MTNMAMSVDFLSAFARLPSPQQRGVRSLIARFNNNPTASGLNYERIKGAKNPTCARCASTAAGAWCSGAAASPFAAARASSG